eukprot:gene9364-12615_t
MRFFCFFLIIINNCWTISSTSLSVTFTNSIKNNKISDNYTESTITLYWFSLNQVDGVEESIEIADIPSLESLSISTYAGHTFYATIKGSNELLYPYEMHMSEYNDHYHIGGNPLIDQIKYVRFRNNHNKNAITVYSHEPFSIMINKYCDIEAGDVMQIISISEVSFSSSLINILNQTSNTNIVKFRSLAPKVNMWYDDGHDGIFQGSLLLGQETTINVYEGHVFYFTDATNNDNELDRVTMTKDTVLVLINDTHHAPPVALLDLYEQEAIFMKDYYNQTGRHWRHFYDVTGPRSPPTLFMWPNTAIGDYHHVQSNASHWHCTGLESISTEPRAFLIEGFLSDFEIDVIRRLAAPKVDESLVGNNELGGGRKSTVRTSRNTWISRDTNTITETISLRAADILNISESFLHNHKNVEDMQVVHYKNGQKYDSHIDWGVRGYPESRLITLLLYLTDMTSPTAGGETAFPKGANGLGFKINPKKGNAVLFYNMLEDGNGDVLSLHAALPCVEGEKWLANFWVWDPKRK